MTFYGEGNTIRFSSDSSCSLNIVQWRSEFIQIYTVFRLIYFVDDRGDQMAGFSEKLHFQIVSYIVQKCR